MKREYHEGKTAGENFENLGRAIFQAKKTTVPPAKVAQKKRVLRPKKSGKDKA